MKMNIAMRFAKIEPLTNLDAFGVQLLRPDTFFDDGGLDVELHERRDRCAGGRDEEKEVAGVELNVRCDDRVSHIAQCGLARIAAIG
jgi:hypothetical protein